MHLSGPVDAVKVEFRGRTYLLLSDRHNSTEGSCPGACADLSLTNQAIGGQENCETILHFLHRQLTQGADFFLEASYVLRDAPRPKLHAVLGDGLQTFDYGDSKSENFDYIDRMLYLFHDSFLRNKKMTQYPNSMLHYVDIRDVFLGTYNESGTREMISVNPFSGSIVVKAFRDAKNEKEYHQIYQEGKVLLRYILDHAWDYYRSYLGKGETSPLPLQKGKLFDEFRARLSRREMLNSKLDGLKVFRVAKQLLKIPKELRDKLEQWSSEAFKEELIVSETFYEEWCNGMENLLREGTPLELLRIKAESLRMHPISCLVALSSVIMDVYLLARSFYHQHTDSTIFYCGAAHIENHINFFTRYGGRVLEKSHSTNRLERCILSI